ncbi:MAG TPA: hypothetical protein G4N95_07670 [Anaerolineae bacterium]|nr:hypothetical protein [Anaerolineae bacterium]
MIDKKLREIIGNMPTETGFKKRMRFHQGWWRAFVLAEEQGYHPIRKDELIGSAIRQGEINGKNFISENIRKAVKDTLKEREAFGGGIMEEERLFNNLLSSQPLCFNFWGELKVDKELARDVLRRFYPKVTGVRKVMFEYTPGKNYTNDNSAFDVAFEVADRNRVGLIGLECKYTDTFSQREYDKEEYQEIYRRSENFVRPYEEYIQSRYNQLFRNQLIAEALIQNGAYDFVLTGLFCHQADEQAVETGREFQKMLRRDRLFRVITYREYIEEMLQLPLEWEQRENVMILWARYCATDLSDNAFRQERKAT